MDLASDTRASGDDRIVYRWPCGSYGESRPTLGTYRGRERADLRFWIPDADVESESDELRPTKTGISVRVDELRKLLEAVQALMEARPRA